MELIDQDRNRRNGHPVGKKLSILKESLETTSCDSRGATFWVITKNHDAAPTKF